VAQKGCDTASFRISMFQHTRKQFELTKRSSMYASSRLVGHDIALQDESVHSLSNTVGLLCFSMFRNVLELDSLS